MKLYNHGEGPSRAFSWLKVPTSAFTFKTLLRQLRHYAKRALTPRLVDVKLGRRRNYHEGRVAIRHYAKPTRQSLMTFALAPQFHIFNQVRALVGETDWSSAALL